MRASRGDSVAQLGTLPIDADTIVAGNYRALVVLPRISETVFGEWETASTIVLTAPANFQFNVAQLCTATITAGNVDLGNGAGVAKTATPLAGTITFTVATASTAGNAATIEFSNIHLRPTVQNCSTAAAGDRSDITVTCSGGNNLNVATAVVDVTVTAGVKAKLGFSVQPTQTAVSTAIAPAVEVEIQDQCGNVTADTDVVFMAIGNNPSAGALGGTTFHAAVAGTATFNDLTINKVGVGYTLHAVSGVLTDDTSSAFNIVAGAPAALRFVQQPSNTASDANIAPAVTVEVIDAGGNRVLTAVNAVTLTIDNNPGSGTLTGGGPTAAVAGLATFNTLNINKVGTGYTLHAASGVLTAVNSNTFNIAPGTKAKLAYVQAPTDAAAGVAIAPAVTVEILDVNDNRVTSAVDNVTIAILANPSGGTLTGGGAVAAVAGVATFNNLKIDTAGNGYTLRATSGVLTGVTSAAFNITAGVALLFVQQPSNAAAAVAIAPAVTVKIVDSGGNQVSSTANVTIAIGTNAGGGTLSGTLTHAAVAGLATFNDLSIEKSGTGYTLHATSAGLTAATLSAFNITPGTPTKLHFGQQPANTDVSHGLFFTVQILDNLDNLVTTAVNPVTIAIQNNPSGGILAGTNPKAAVGGVATFSDLTIDKVGAGYTLQATSGVLTAATLDPFNMTAGTNLTDPVIVLTASDDLSVTYTIEGATTVHSFRTVFGLDRDMRCRSTTCSDFWT